MAAMFVAKNAIFTLPKAFPFPAVPSALPLRARRRVSRVCFCSSSASKTSHQESDRDPRWDSRADMSYRSRETRMEMDEGPEHDVTGKVKGPAKEATEAAKQRAGQIKEKAKEDVATAEEWAEQMREKAKENAERMKDETKSTVETMAEKARASKERAKERANQTMEKTAETKEKTEELAESAVEEAKKGTHKVAETVQNLGEKAKGTVKDAFGAAKETTHKIKETLAGPSSSEDDETKRMSKKVVDDNKLY